MASIFETKYQDVSDQLGVLQSQSSVTAADLSALSKLVDAMFDAFVDERADIERSELVAKEQEVLAIIQRVDAFLRQNGTAILSGSIAAYVAQLADAIADAETARDKAQDWAEKAEDVEVDPGKFSSFHWAQKSEDFRDSAQTIVNTALSTIDHFEPDKATADANLVGIPYAEGDVVAVAADETRSGGVAIYKVISAALVFQLDLASVDANGELVEPPKMQVASRAVLTGTLTPRPNTLVAVLDNGVGGNDGLWIWRDGDTATADGGTILESSVSGYEPLGPNEGRWHRVYSGAVHPEWWLADPNGVGDSVAGFSGAISKAMADNVPVMATGDYVFTTVSSTESISGETLYSALLAENDSATAQALTIFGGGKITCKLNYNTSGEMAIWLRVKGNLSSLVIDNLFIENDHGAVQGDSIAISTDSSTGGYRLSNVQVKGCTLKDHSRHLFFSDCDGVLVEGNQFLMEDGRDGGVTNTRPVVGVWCLGDGTGLCTDVRIVNNVYNGYTNPAGNAGTTNKTAGDGFVYGHAKGWLVANNYIRNFAYEGVFIKPQEDKSADATVYPTLVTGNVVDATLAADWTNAGTDATLRTRNWGIRVDESGARVAGNMIYDAHVGILSFGSDYASIDLTDVSIDGNVIYMAPDKAYSGITVNGHASQITSLPTIANNTILMRVLGTTGASVVSGVNMANVSDGQLLSNNISFLDVGNGAQTYYGVYLASTVSASGSGNSIVADTGFLLSNAASYTQIGEEYVSATAFSERTTYSGASLFKSQSTAFTPGSTGYYRVLSFQAKKLSGKMRITGAYNNQENDNIVQFGYWPYGTSEINHSISFLGGIVLNSGCVNKVRVSHDTATGMGYVDVNVRDVTTPAPITCEYFENNESNIFVESTPTYNPTVGGEYSQELLLSSYPSFSLGPVQIFFVTGSPETVIAAPVGSVAFRGDGGASTTLYVKESGTGNTGWVAK